MSRKRQCSGSPVVGESFAELAVCPSCSANVAYVSAIGACIGGLRPRAFIKRPMADEIGCTRDSIGCYECVGHGVVVGSI